MSKYFRPEEFVRPDLLRPYMLPMLDELREIFGKPLIVSSSLRDSQKNKAVNGASNSSHLLAPDGLYSGIDLTVKGGLSSTDRFRLVKWSIATRFTRIGVYQNHIHLDIEERLPQAVLWVGTD